MCFSLLLCTLLTEREGKKDMQLSDSERGVSVRIKPFHIAANQNKARLYCTYGNVAHVKCGHDNIHSTFFSAVLVPRHISDLKFETKKQIKRDCSFQSSLKAQVIFGKTKYCKQYVCINGSSLHLYGLDFKELRL